MDEEDIDIPEDAMIAALFDVPDEELDEAEDNADPEGEAA